MACRLRSLRRHVPELHPACGFWPNCTATRFVLPKQCWARLEDDLVADTTGAGDAFIGSICHGIATGMELGDAMRLGAYVAAKKCLKLGARPGLPKRDDVPSQLFEPYPDETP